MITTTMLSELSPKDYSPQYSLGLPADEYQYLKNLHSIETHFSSSSSSSKTSSTYPSSPRKCSSTNMEQARRISEIRYATRKALGQSFNFTNDSHNMINSTQTRHDGAMDDAVAFLRPEIYQGKYNWLRYVEGPHAQNSLTHKQAKFYLADALQHKAFNSTQGGYDGSNPVETMLSQAAQYETTYCIYSSRPIPEYRTDRNHRPVRTMEYALSPLRSKFSWDDSISEDNDR